MRIIKRIVKQLVNHARSEAPFESCGYLAAQDGIISASYPLINQDKSNEHFSFDPKEQFAVVRDARARGLEICAVYHSHPLSPARPSAEDIKLAHDPNILYVIISLAKGTEEVRAFRINKGEVAPVSLEVINEGV